MASKDLSFLTNSKSSRLEATALEKAKREAELEEMRRLRAQTHTDHDWDNGAAPITDIEGWRNSQKALSEEEKRKKMEATEGLHGYRGKEPIAKKREGKDGKVFKQWEGKKIEHEGDVVGPDDEGEEEVHNKGEEEYCVDVNDAVKKFESASEGAGDDSKGNDAAKTAHKQPNEPKLVVDETEQQEIEAPDSTGQDEQVVYAEKEEETTAEPEQPIVEDPVIEEPAAEPEPETEEPEVNEIATPTPAPTYKRTDIKFSFGLIVRSNHPANSTFENLRDNETLRKCMESTSNILIKEMPSPPKIVEDEIGVDYSSFPKAYYDPSLEPTVLSIDEDKKDSTKVIERGNKRTLVKASFPVFLQTAGDNHGDNALLKETKSTVFKALRAAVSGGQFLK